MSAFSDAPRASRLLTLAVMVAVTGLCLAACSSKSSGTPADSNNSGSTTTTSSSSGTSTSTTTAANPNSSLASRLVALEQTVQSAKGSTFKATYSESSSTEAGSHVLTFEQMPPKFLFDITGAQAGTILYTGTATYACSGASGHEQCYSLGTTNPFGPLIDVIDGAAADTQFKSLHAGLVSKLAGVSASFSNQTFAGQSAQCVSGVKGADRFKYCITNSGVLAYAGGSTATGGGSLTLTAYSTSVSASDFDLPAGATS
jgi:hypothetical protein